MYSKYFRSILSAFLVFTLSLAFFDASAQDKIITRPKAVNTVKNGGKSHQKDNKSKKDENKSKQEPKIGEPKTKPVTKPTPLSDFMIKPGESASIDRTKVLGGQSYNGNTIMFQPATMSIILDNAQPEKVLYYNLILINGKTYTMGAKSNESQKVTIDAYYIGESEVPQWLWNAIMSDNPSTVKGDMLPVNNVSWDKCQTFIAELNKLLKKNLFYLPSEAQWEFAAKEGNKNYNKKYSGTDNDMNEYAWTIYNSNEKPQDVKGKKSNDKGIYGMTGNVMEWCYDWYENFDNDLKNAKTNYIGPDAGSDKVLRGGSYDCSDDNDYRIETRFNQAPDIDGQWTGFRLAFTFIDANPN